MACARKATRRGPHPETSSAQSSGLPTRAHGGERASNAVQPMKLNSSRPGTVSSSGCPKGWEVTFRRARMRSAGSLTPGVPEGRSGQCRGAGRARGNAWGVHACTRAPCAFDRGGHRDVVRLCPRRWSCVSRPLRGSGGSRAMACEWTGRQPADLDEKQKQRLFPSVSGVAPTSCRRAAGPGHSPTSSCARRKAGCLRCWKAPCAASRAAPASCAPSTSGWTAWRPRPPRRGRGLNRAPSPAPSRNTR